MFGRLLSATAITVALCVPVWGQNAANPIIFPVGETGTRIEGSIAGREVADFALTARKGQTLSVRMETDNPTSYFNIFAPGATPGEDEAIFIGSTAGLEATLTMPAEGSYLIRAYLMPSAGRRGETANYTLAVSVDGGEATGGDGATISAEGPDLWTVSGVDGQLNIRSEPSTDAEVLTTVGNGAELRNDGCKPLGGTQWCQVSTTSGTAVTGWAVGTHLSAAEPGAEAPEPATIGSTAPPAKPAEAASRMAVDDTRPSDAPDRSPSSEPPRESPAVSAKKPAPKPDSAAPDATGEVPCSVAAGMPTRNCAMSVTRTGEGTATVTIAWPDGGSREIRFEAGAPVPAEGLSSERRGDLTVVTIGEERYEIPDAVVNGG
ncbi:SH3 domain-containing protein [Paracoccus sediminicola]|uniref:SH3 domain-containing protein n=1 Tax=Paracoccus sediminicola TaxID=3017783 RepID=UPI0022F0FD43|nr:SH3 domain-containing protein [Paracoccus sediminicola]WBU57168.1 SH3 domain-containing protein [Paracoccus sediminicola]